MSNVAATTPIACPHCGTALNESQAQKIADALLVRLVESVAMGHDDFERLLASVGVDDEAMRAALEKVKP